MQLSEDDFISEEIDLNNALVPDLTSDQAWPGLLLELRGIIDDTLEGKGINNKALSLAIVLDIAEYMGGVQVYLPRGDKLRQQGRDIEIYEQFKGNNIKQLAHKYHLTDKTIYEIIAKMRNIELKQRQPDLFG